MELIMGNGQMGASTYSLKPSLLQPFGKIGANPISRFASERERVRKNRIFSGVGAESGKGLVESARLIGKQFEFEPSFDEYLKAMESVKTGRERRPAVGDNSRDKGEKIAKPSFLETSNGEFKSKLDDEENERGLSTEWELGEGEDDDEVASQSTKDQMHRGSYRNTRTISEVDSNERGFDEKRKYTSDTERVTNFKGVDKWVRERKQSHDTSIGSTASESSLGRTLNHWETTSNSEKIAKSSYLETSNGDFKSKLDYEENERDLSTEWELGEGEDDDDGVASQFNASQRTTKYQMHQEVDSNGRGFDVKRKYTNVQKTSNTERMTNFKGVDKWVRERKQSHDASIGSTASESSLDRTLNHWKTTSNGEMELGETRIWKRKSTPQRSEVDRQMHDYNISERKSSYGIERNVSVPEREKQCFRSSTEHLELDRNYSRTGDTRSIKSGKFAKGSKLLKEEDGEDDMEMERAAFKSFEVFTDLRGQPRVLRMEMEERIQHLAKWLNGTDINMPEWLFSKMIHSARIKFSDHSILRVIQILGTLGNWRRVLQVIEWLESRERFKSYKSRYIYTTALDVLGKAKRPVEALNVFHAMRKGMSSYPDLAAYHCIAVTLGQAGYVKELFDVIDCMRSPPPTKFNTGYIEKWDPRLEPDIIVYNAVLNACARRKQWEGAFWVLQQLKEQGLQPSSTTYGLVMEVMFACEKYNLVYDFFRKVQKSTIPSTLNYKVLVNTLWKEGKTDDAVFAVKDMERRGIVGSASLYYDLARCLCSAGRCQEALMQMDNICKVARKPLVVTYTGLIQACFDAGNVQDGTYIFKQMQAFCSPNLVTFNIMLKAYLQHGMFVDAKELFQKMLDESSHITRRSDYKNIVTPDSYTFNTMLDACAAEQKWDDFRYIFQEMLRRGYNFNSKRHLRMILDACRAGKGELLETTRKHLVQANRVPPPPLIKEMFCMKLENNDYTAAITSITSYPTNDLPLLAFSEKGWLDLLQANTDRFQKDTIIRLTHKLNDIVAGSDRPHPIIQNLINSCREFIKTHSIAGEINSEEMRENSYVS